MAPSYKPLRDDAGDDDSSGKGKILGSQHRAKVLGALFVLGLCAGVIVAERAYLSTNAGDIAKGATLPAKQARALKRPSVTSDPALAELEAALLRIAPTKEVMIGVANANPLREGMLLAFVDAVERAGVRNYVIVALDKETEEGLKEKGKNVVHMPIQVFFCVCFVHFVRAQRTLSPKP